MSSLNKNLTVEEAVEILKRSQDLLIGLLVDMVDYAPKGLVHRNALCKTHKPEWLPGIIIKTPGNRAGVINYIQSSRAMTGLDQLVLPRAIQLDLDKSLIKSMHPELQKIHNLDMNSLCVSEYIQGQIAGKLDKTQVKQLVKYIERTGWIGPSGRNLVLMPDQRVGIVDSEENAHEWPYGWYMRSISNVSYGITKLRNENDLTDDAQDYLNRVLVLYKGAEKAIGS